MVAKTARIYQIEARLALDESGVNCDRVPKRSVTLTTAMTHIAIQEALNGKQVDWMEHVTDEQDRRS